MGDRGNETGTDFDGRLSRRTFLALAAEGASVLALGAFIRLLARKDSFLRPPGAATKEEFLSLCIKCQRCAQVCPTGTIMPVLLTESPASVGTPKLNFGLGYCSLCMRCIEACPTGALEPIQGEAARLGVAKVDQGRCIAWTWSGCTQCQQVCPLDAITLDSNRRPTVDANKCNGCGLCEYVCPSSALRSYARGGGKGIVVVPLGA